MQKFDEVRSKRDNSLFFYADCKVGPIVNYWYDGSQNKIIVIKLERNIEWRMEDGTTLHILNTNKNIGNFSYFRNFISKLHA